jgi:hypothetical protein
MITKFTAALALALALPLAGYAADHGHSKPEPTPEAKEARAAQQKAATKAELVRVQNRGAAAGHCRDQAEEKGLHGLEAKQFIAACRTQ